MSPERRFPRWAGWVVAIGVVAAIVVVWRARAHARGEAPKFQTAQVDRGRIAATVTATGTLSALVTVQVGSQVSGRVAQLNVDFNSPVKKGEVIAVIDPQLYEAALEQAQANALAAKAALTKAQVQATQAARDLKRSQALREQKLIAQSDLDTAQSNADVAKAQVEAAKASLAQSTAALHQAQVNLGYTKIVSPINGTVISRSVDVGQTVAASLQAPTLFTIAEDLRRMQVDTSIAEADVGKLQAGMMASFTVDAYPHRRFHGKIRQIRNAPTTVSNVVTYDAVIDVENDDLSLKPGMTANVTIVYAEADDALRVPNAALRYQPPEGHGRGSWGAGRAAWAQGGGERPHRPKDPNHKLVWVLRDGAPARVPIEIGITDGAFTEVKDGGLQAGDAVITGSSAPAGEGRPVRLRF